MNIQPDCMAKGRLGEEIDNQKRWRNLKVSRFCQFVDSNGGAVGLNTLHRSVAKLDDEIVQSLKKKTLNSLPYEDIELLKKAKFLVPKDVDEVGLFRDWAYRIKYDTSSIRATIALTSRCNLDCSYCFEKGHMRQSPLDMSKKTADNIVSWLKTFASKYNSQKVSAYYYGGEPTLRIELIDYICEELEAQLKPLGIDNSFYMYTNGTIITDDLLRTIKNRKFQHLQVTLDGPRRIHNKRRGFKTGKGSFQIILTNIRRILGETYTKILLLVNFDQENHEHIPELLDILEQEGIARNVELAFNPVFQTNFNRAHCDQFSLPEFRTYQVWKTLYELALQRGFNCNALRIFQKGPCSFNRRSYLIFDPSGDIYKCIGFLGTQGLKVGNVKDNFLTTLERIEKQVAIEPWDNDKCRNCALLPLCLGGCRFHSYVKYGNITNTFCHEDLIKNVELGLIEELTRAGKEF